MVVKLDKTETVVRGEGLPPGFDEIEAFPQDITWRRHLIRRGLIVLAGRRDVGTNPEKPPAENP